MKNTFIKQIIFIVALSFIFSMSACTKRHLDARYNPQGFPVKTVYELLERHLHDFVTISDPNVYIHFKYFNIYYIESLGEESIEKNTLAISKDESVFYFLNYPDTFAINNFNRLIRPENYRISSESQANLFCKFMATIFLPDTSSIDELVDAFDKGTSKYDIGLRRATENYYKTKIVFENGTKKIEAHFYTLNGGSLMYKWDVKLKPSGHIIALRVTVMTLDADYMVNEQLVIFDKKGINLNIKKPIYDPTE